MLISALVMSKIFYGCEVLNLSTDQERTLRSAVVAALWGRKSSKGRNSGILLTTFLKGHVVDPAQIPHVRRLSFLRRCMRNRPELYDLTRAIWEGRLRRRRQRGAGYVENLLFSMQRLKADLGPGYIEFPEDDESEATMCFGFKIDGRSYTTLDTRATWDHGCRELGRRAVLASVEKERKRDGSELGFGVSINRADSIRLYHKVDARTQGILRTIMVGGVYTNHRHNLVNEQDSALCPHCGQTETLEHLWWLCPHYAHCRQGLRCIDHILSCAPRCVTRLGLQPLGSIFPIETIQKMQVQIFKERFGPNPEHPSIPEVESADSHLYASPRDFAFG